MARHQTGAFEEQQEFFERVQVSHGPGADPVGTKPPTQPDTITAGDGTPPAAKADELPVPSTGWTVAGAGVQRDFAAPYGQPGQHCSALQIIFENRQPPAHESTRDAAILEGIRAALPEKLAKLRGLHTVVETAEIELANLAAQESDIIARRKVVLGSGGPDLAAKLAEINRELTDVAAKKSAHESTRVAILEARHEAFAAVTREADTIASVELTKARNAVVEELDRATKKLAAAAGEALTDFLKLERNRLELFVDDKGAAGRLLHVLLVGEGLPGKIEPPSPSAAPAKARVPSEYEVVGALRVSGIQLG